MFERIIRVEPEGMGLRVYFILKSPGVDRAVICTIDQYFPRCRESGNPEGSIWLQVMSRVPQDIFQLKGGACACTSWWAKAPLCESLGEEPCLVMDLGDRRKHITKLFLTKGDKAVWAELEKTYYKAFREKRPQKDAPLRRALEI